MAKLHLGLAAALLCGLWPSAFAQNAISAKAGLVQVADGEVFVNDKAVEHKVAQFTDLKSKDILTTGEGRAEVLLTPGAFLRMTDTSGIRMVSTRLSDVRMDLVKGEAVVEIAELLTDNSITVNVGSAAFELRKGGIYRFDSTPGRVRVYQGEANASAGEQKVTVKAGHEFAESGNSWALGHFDTKDTDALYRWSSRRSGSIAVANVSAARQAGSSYGSYSSFMNTGSYGALGNGMYGTGNGMYGTGNGMYGTGGSWMYNPYFGMYTFMPFAGTAWSPFGYAYYTPITVGRVYAYAPGQGTSVTQVGAARGVRGSSSGSNQSLPMRTNPALTTSSGLHTSAITRGGVGESHTGFTGGSGSYANGRSGNSSYAGTSSANSTVSNSVAVSSSAPARSAGGGGGAAVSSGGGGGTRSH
jgi:hypothetical protein